MSERGYYIIARGFAEHPMFKREPRTEDGAFQWLIEEAAWKDWPRFRVNGDTYDLTRGQYACTAKYLADKWGRKSWDESRVWRCLKKWVKHGAINIKSTRQSTLITLYNYDKYQSPRKTERQTNETQSTDERQHTEETKIIKFSEKVEARKRASRLPEDFLLTDERRAVAVGHGIPNARVAGVFGHFRDHHTAKGSVMKDWDAAWRTWCRNDSKFGGRNGASANDRKDKLTDAIDDLVRFGSGGNPDARPVS